MKKLINFIPVGVLSIIATVLVVYLLLSPESSLPSSWLSLFKFKHADKVIHLLLFFLLNAVYLYDYTKLKNPHHTKINKELAITTLAASIGLLTEVGQLAMGLGRAFDVDDIVADVLGAFLAFALMHWWGSHVLRKYLFNTRRSHRKHRHHHHHHHHNDDD